MGTFIGHILPGAGFLAIGIWHLFNTIRNYVEAPWNFQSRAWFPTRFSNKYLKRLELLAIIFGGCLSIAAELFICPEHHQPFADDWSIPVVHLNNFEHSTISLFFVIYGVTCLCTEIYKFHVPRGWLTILGVIVFSQELMLFHFHSADHMGLEGHYHWLLQLPIIVGLIAGVLEVVAPAAVLAALVRAISIIFQGTWFIQIGLNLYVPSMVAAGCEIVWREAHAEVVCGTEMADMRAKALANLFFSWHFAAILVVSMFSYLGILHRHSGQQLQYEPLLTHTKETGRVEEKHHHHHQQTIMTDVEAGLSPRSSHDGESHSSESDIEMSSISLER